MSQPPTWPTHAYTRADKCYPSCLHTPPHAIFSSVLSQRICANVHYNNSHFQNGYQNNEGKCRYCDRLLYFSHCCEACLLNSALDEQANYCSSNSLICPNFLVDLQEISGGSWSFVLRRCSMLRVVEGEFIQDLMSKVDLFSSNIWRYLRRCEKI